MEILSTLLKPVVDFALPPRCPICGVTVEADNRFCLSCWNSLDFLTEPWCASCGRPFAFEQAAGTQCAACLKKPPDHDGVRAVVAYDDNSSLLPMRLKYGGRLGFAELIAGQLERFLGEIPADALIVPVPLHRWRLWSRGFNQSVLIGRALSERSGIAMETGVLARKDATPPLRSMSAKERRRLVKNAFAVSHDAQSKLKGRAVILIDDVYTTGSTANACARILKVSGADQVTVFCWARVLTEYDQS
ncbi:ComF family protein [Sphingorhabdus sp. EL138]|uniref:ComF family protein n=1 Tax=Sphingorhabdus sp. EL138 TaxID=2073156 RepID=UPI000D69DA19|nr:ComF family protein [Sphingorhabdus sp. EL138]